MTHIKLYTGLAGSQNVIEVEWFDHNHISHILKIEVNVQNQDKPRTLEILLNNMKIAEIPPRTE